MTNEKLYEHICVMLREYDLHTGNRGADGVISNPEKWIFSDQFPFYAAAAEMLIEIRSRMDTKSTSRSVVAAITRIYKNCEKTHPKHPNLFGIFTRGDRFVVCDGYRLLRLTNDISSLPHVENDFNVDSVMKGVDPTTETIKLPTIGELRAYIIENSARHGNKTVVKSYCLGGFVWCDPKYLLDMLQALPGCVAYKPKSRSSPIYFNAPNGDDGILMPVKPPDLTT